MPQQQNQSKLGSMKPAKVGAKKPIIDKNAPGMDSPFYSTKAMGMKYGDHPTKKSTPKKMTKTPKKVSKTPSYSKVMKSVKKTMGY